ncbi:MAG: hypothetical protein ACREB3_07080, partial [Burkholderiales bacterium]
LALDTNIIDYDSSDLTALVPEVCEPEVVRMAVQRKPDTWAHFVLSDGTVAMLVYDKVEQVVGWFKVESLGAGGIIEDVMVLPAGSGRTEDHVYYTIKRTVNGATVRYHEKWALESECTLDSTGQLAACKLADSHVVYSGAAATVISVAHLIGQQVVVWANGVDVGTDATGNLIHTVSGGGTITLSVAATPVVVGLRYSAPWQSAKLVELMADPGGSLADQQIIRRMDLILADVHAKGLKFGRNLTEAQMNDLPMVDEDGSPVGANEIRSEYVMADITFPGDYSHNARLCLLAKAPRPCTVLAAIADLEHHG